MPRYCYSNRDGTGTVERIYPMGKAPRRIRDRGRVKYRDLVAEHRDFHDTGDLWLNHTSQSMAVLASQKSEAEAAAAAAGCPVTYEVMGYSARPRFSDKAHWKRFCRAMGVHDLDGGDGSP
jgi:hypothetical protein